MSDHFSIANLEAALSRLSSSNPDSLIDDPIFKMFQTALDEPFSGLRELWQDLFNQQRYLDIVEYIVPIPHLAQHIHNNEPGVFIDYKSMRENLHVYQDYIQGGQQVVLDMYEFLNHFTGVHVTFIRSTVSMAIWQLFSKMLDRFYGYISDIPFESFVQDTIDIHNIDWPSYDSVKSKLTTHIRDAQVEIYKAAQELTHLKSSSDIVTFTSHLATAAAYKNKLTIDNSQLDLGNDLDLENDLVEDPRVSRILSKYTGPKTRATLISRRKAAIMKRNAMNTQARITKNQVLRQTNRDNIHQYGNMSRIPISDSVVRALSMIQETYRVSLTEEDEDEAGVVGSMKQMSLEAMEEEMKVKDPLGGMMLGEGFKVLNPFQVPA